MSDRRARIQAVSEWLMEFSVLWAVFPLLDQLLEDKPIRMGLLVVSYSLSMVAGIGGILLRRAVTLMYGGMITSALCGLTMFIIGLILKYYPEDDRDRKRKSAK